MSSIFDNVRFLNESNNDIISKFDFFKILKTTKVNYNAIDQIKEIYGYKLPKELISILSYSKESIFIEDGIRTLSESEIINANIDLKINFVKNNMIPVFDCGDNDFIVYHLNTKIWSKFNIVDEIIFSKSSKLSDIL